MMRTTLLLVLSLAVVPAAQAMYKWVDDKGVTQYTESPPPDRPSTKVEVKPPGPPAAGGSADNWKERDLESRRRAADKARQDERDKAKEDKLAAQRKSRCRDARRGLLNLERPAPAYVENERGEQLFIPDKDRPRWIEVWRKRVTEACD